jgi:hypothetical protein
VDNGITDRRGAKPSRPETQNTEAERPIWQYRAGAIPKVRRRRGGAAWPRGRREAAAGGWTTGEEAAAYPGPDGGRRLREREDGGGRRLRSDGQRRDAELFPI